MPISGDNNDNLFQYFYVYMRAITPFFLFHIWDLFSSLMTFQTEQIHGFHSDPSITTALLSLQLYAGIQNKSTDCFKL